MECCELPQRGLGLSPSRNRIWCILAIKSDLWWQPFPWFSSQSTDQIRCSLCRQCGPFWYLFGYWGVFVPPRPPPCVRACTEWPILCWCAVKKLLTHSLSEDVCSEQSNKLSVGEQRIGSIDSCKLTKHQLNRECKLIHHAMAAACVQQSWSTHTSTRKTAAPNACHCTAWHVKKRNADWALETVSARNTSTTATGTQVYNTTTFCAMSEWVNKA